MRLLSTIRSFLRLEHYLRRLEQYPYQELYQELGIRPDSVYGVHRKFFSRARQYVKGFGLLGLCFQELIQRPLTEAEFRRLLLFSHMAPLYDDLFDRLHLEKERVRFLVRDPANVIPQSAEEEWFLSFCRPVFAEVKTSPDFLHYADLLTDSQEQSKRQLKENLDFDELNAIVRNKGGYSCLLLRSLLDEPLSEAEKQGLFQLGAMCQYMDDIFDWYDDLRENRSTIASRLPLVELSRFYSDQLKIFSQSGLPVAFVREVEIYLTPAFICLDYFQKRGVVTSRVTTERIICDMEKPANVLRLVFKSVL